MEVDVGDSRVVLEHLGERQHVSAAQPPRADAEVKLGQRRVVGGRLSHQVLEGPRRRWVDDDLHLERLALGLLALRFGLGQVARGLLLFAAQRLDQLDLGRGARAAERALTLAERIPHLVVSARRRPGGDHPGELVTGKLGVPDITKVSS